jgi:hypothetical protein
MASLIKLFKSPKAYTSKKFNSAKATIKGNKMGLAASLMLALSEVAQDADHYQRNLPGARDPLSSMLKGGATITQAWQAAKDGRKKSDKIKAASDIISDTSISQREKIAKLQSLGDFKAAESLSRTRIANKGIKYKKKGFEQKVKMDDYHIGDTDRKYNKSVQDTDWEHTHQNEVFGETKKQNSINNAFTERKIRQADTHHEDSMNSATERAVIKAMGNVLKGKATGAELIFLIKNKGLAKNMRMSKGIPFVGPKGKAEDIGGSYWEGEERKTNKRNSLDID